MKKFFYAAFLLVIIAGTFWAGSRYSQREAGKVDPSGGKSSAVNSGRTPDTDTEPSSSPPGTLKITPGRQQAIGLRVDSVDRTPAVHTIRLLGRVAVDGTRIYRINASVDGWIKETTPSSVGVLVKKNEVLATFYSPQFLDAEQGYLYALGTVERLGPARRMELGRKEAPSPAALDPYVVQRQIDVLRGMGMGDDQIEEVGRTRQLTQDIRITSPADGFITARNVSPEQRFSKGTELYQIADLSLVWILADVYGHEVQYFNPGVKATVHLPHQKRTYHATVSKVLPAFDATTRTLKVRLESDNPDYVLKPDMFVDIELPIQLPPAIAVPADAILDSGVKKTVFVDRGNGFFEPREVETGWRVGNRVEIVRGLAVGERIVTSGTFLIDSESKLELAAQGMYTTLSKDPVCGAEVSQAKAEKAGRKVSYKGKTYYFDSDECKDQFQKIPGKFLKETAEGTPAEKAPSPKVPAKQQGQDHRHG